MTQPVGGNTLERLIGFTQKRQGVLASNIANSDTPDYKAKDIRFEDFLQGGGLPLMLTNERDIDPPMSDSDDESVHLDKSAPWKDGNNVQIDMQVAKMDENAMLYEAGIKLLGTEMSMYQADIRTV